MTAWTAGLPGPRPAVRSAGTRATTGRRMHPWTPGGPAAPRGVGGRVHRAAVVRRGHRPRRPGAHHDRRPPRRGARRAAGRAAEGLHAAGGRRAGRSLPSGCLDGALPGDQVARLAGALAEARALRRGALCDLDVADPIEGPAGAHAAAVHAVADSLVPLMGALEARPLTEETVRITRLPPFRCSRGTADHLLSRGRQPPAQRRRA